MSGHFARGHGALATSPHMVGMSYRIRYYDKGGQEVGIAGVGGKVEDGPGVAAVIPRARRPLRP